MTLLFVEYVPHVLIGAAGLIAAAVAIDFGISKFRRLSTRLAKISRGTTIKDSGRGLVGKPAPLGNEDLEGAAQPSPTSAGETLAPMPNKALECDLSSDRQEATSAECGEVVIVLPETGRRVGVMANSERLGTGAPTERCEPVQAGADTERCEPVPAVEIVQSVLKVEPTPQSVRVSTLGVGNMGRVPATDSRSLVAMATNELKQARRQRSAAVEIEPLGDEVLAKRDPSVRIVDSVLAGSDRRVPL